MPLPNAVEISPLHLKRLNESLFTTVKRLKTVRRVDDLGKAKRRRVDPVPLKYHHDPTFETLVITRTGDVGLPGGCYSVSGVKHGRFSSTEDHAEKLAAPC